MSASRVSIKLLSLKVRGLNMPEKHSQTLREAHRARAHIIFLQETHSGDSSPTTGIHCLATQLTQIQKVRESLSSYLVDSHSN